MTFHKNREWILFADRAHAKIYTRHYVNGAMQEHLILEHPEARKFQHEQGTDRPGRGQAAGTGQHHAYEDHADFPEQESQAFLKEVGREINEAAENDQLDKLVLIALPKTMAMVKSTFSKSTLKKVTGEYSKNLINIPESDLQERLTKLEELPES